MKENHMFPELRHGGRSVLADFAGYVVHLLVFVLEDVVKLLAFVVVVVV
jgi:hypothetical protein